MSLRWPNSIVKSTFTAPTTSSAPGAWKISTVAEYVQQGLWPAPPPNYDPYFYDVSLLLSGNGTNGANNNTFLDSSTNNFTITRNGNATQGTFTPYGSLWSNYFDGQAAPNTAKLSIANTSALDLGTGDFTLECWFFSSKPLADYGGQYVFLFGKGSGNGTGEYAVGLYQSKIYFQGVQTSTTLSANTWYHVAVVKSSGTVKIYVNGTLGATGSNSTDFTNSTSFNIGDRQASDPYSQYPFNGYISNIRIVKGTAVYTTNFTPSTTPLTAISGTALLTCQSNHFVDNSSNNLSMVVRSAPSVQRFSPFNPATPYSAATLGGSGYFDGAGDYLSLPASSAYINNGSTNFTLEFWAYANADGYYYLMDQGSGNQSAAAITFSSTAGSGTVILYNSSYGSLVQNYSLTIYSKTWTHFAFVRNGSTVTVYINGVSSAAASNSYAFGKNDTFLICKYGGGSGYEFNGYLTDFRYVNGTAVYTSNFTPPTAPLTAITNTQVLTKFTNAGIPDAAMQSDFETVGGAQISTAQSKFGTSSLYFDGTGDYLLSSSDVVLAPGSGNFTIELFCYPNAAGMLVDTRDTTQNGIGLNYGIFDSKFYVIGNNAVLITSSGTFSTGSWYHVAAVRVGSTITLYVNGTSQGTVTETTNFSDQRVTVGSYGLDRTSYNFNGYINDLRITKGYARYTAAFTPPTAAFPTY